MRRKRASLQLEKDDAQEENSELLQNYTRLQASVAELQTRVQEQEEKAMQKAQLDHEIQMLRINLTGEPETVISSNKYCIGIIHYLTLYKFFLDAEKEIERLKTQTEVSVTLKSITS